MPWDTSATPTAEHGGGGRSRGPDDRGLGGISTSPGVLRHWDTSATPTEKHGGGGKSRGLDDHSLGGISTSPRGIQALGHHSNSNYKMI